MRRSRSRSPMAYRDDRRPAYRDYPDRRSYDDYHDHRQPDYHRDHHRQDRMPLYNERPPLRQPEPGALVIETRGEIEKRELRQRERSPGYAIRVENLPFSVDSVQLEKAFKDFGQINECNVLQNDRGQSRGVGLVEFDGKDAASSARQTMDRAKFNGREIFVKIQ